MPRKLKNILLVMLAVTSLFGVSRVQRSLNVDRDSLGLTRSSALDNAPPVLAFTTVALGGFRGLISNLLWIRATELQEQDKFFEMVQLADWITKLEPHFTQVWLQQAWNMAYNISVKFKDFSDRWNWVKRGIILLRDEGLKYNPNDLLIYRELGWFFQHKMGHNLDDAHNYYKRAWYDEMSAIFKGSRPDFEGLMNPSSEDAKATAKQLREEYKIDPKIMREAEDLYGPLDWRLPEPHAIYWAVVGMKQVKANPDRVDVENTMALHRLIYQSMHQLVLHGRIDYVPSEGKLDLSPQLDLLQKTSDAYERALVEEPPKNHDGIRRAHRNLLKDAVYYFYTYDRMKEAAQWYDYLAKIYPNDSLMSGQPERTALTTSLDEYAIARVEELAQDPTSQSDTRMIVEGLLMSGYKQLALGQEDRAGGYEKLAARILAAYRIKTSSSGDRVPLPPLGDIKRSVLQRLLDPERGLPEQLAGQLRTALNLPTNSILPDSTNPK